jgi:5'-3' exoribonuclease 2
MHGPRRFDSRSYPSRGGGPIRAPPRTAAAASSSSSSAFPPPAKDSWLSTFFSIHVFRQRLREILLLNPESGASAVADEEAELAFEHTLHDVVFVMLLFGNDFLPTIGGSIQEGTLDALLSLLATDFVPRGRTLVDPNTNRIQYASARYLLTCLAELPSNKKGGDGDRLHVHNGSGGEAMEWGFTDDKGVKERDAAFIERQQRREQQHERMCYCYWTMLQWALQYSAGIVEHWGCYYPYGRAPPLSKLATYCGVISYDALGEIARRRLESSAMAARRGDGAAAPSGLRSGEEEEEEDDGIEGLPSSAVTSGNGASSSSAVVDAAERGKPTDVMVQLLILIPPRSAALLPTVFRHHYKEIEQAVQAPVEQLNLVSIGAWCEEKKRSLSEEERTRFTAYQFFASDTNLGSAEAPFPAHDIAFSACWNPADVDAELAAQRSEKRKLVKRSAAPLAVEGSGGSGNGVPTSAPSGLQSKAASFFSMGRRPTLSPLGSTATPSPSSPLSSPPGEAGNSVSSAAALLASVNLADAPASSSPLSGLSSTISNPPAPPADTTGATTTAQSRPASLLPTQLRHPKGNYVLWVAPHEALQDPLLVKALGMIQGNRFFAGSYTPLLDQDAVLSRSNNARQDVRLQFRLAVVPLITNLTYGARLLPGYVEPEEVGMRDRVRAARTEEADRTDPWKHMDKLQTMRESRKRVRGEEEEEGGEGGGGEGEEGEEGVGADDAESEKAENSAVAEAEIVASAATTLTATEVVNADAAAADSAAAELQRRKEEARRRLAALKAARQAALDGGD